MPNVLAYPPSKLRLNSFVWRATSALNLLLYFRTSSFAVLRLPSSVLPAITNSYMLWSAAEP